MSSVCPGSPRCLFTGSKTTGGAGTKAQNKSSKSSQNKSSQVKSPQIKRTSRTNLKTNPTHRLTRQTTRQPRNARASSSQTIRHSPEIMKPKDQAVGGGGGDGGGDGAQTREQRGREPDRNGDGTPQCTGRQNLPWRCASPVRLPPPRSSARVVARARRCDHVRESETLHATR